jgi:predicted hotdog family 3-hydroxylacyl-ACP dehydratase
MNAAQIAQLIPHSGDMCLLNEVTAHDDNSITCTAISHRLASNPLREHGQLASVCGIEYAAQAMAIHGSLRSRAANDSTTTTPRGGRLASVRGVEVFVARLDDVKGDLTIHATQIMGDQNNMMYEFSVSAENQVLVQGKATVILVAQVQS